MGEPFRAGGVSVTAYRSAFFVTFLLAAVYRPILSLDFLSAHGLLVDQSFQFALVIAAAHGSQEGQVLAALR
jgi:hypothetical protein